MQQSVANTMGTLSANSEIGVREVRRAVLGTIGAAGAAVAAFDRLYLSAKQFNGAARDLVTDLKAIGDAFPKSSPFLDQTDQLINNIEQIAAKQREVVENWKQQRNLIEDIVGLSTGESEEAAKLAAIEKGRADALGAAKARQANEEFVAAERRKAEAAKEFDRRIKEYDEFKKAVEQQIEDEVVKSLDGEDRIRRETENRIIRVDEMRKKAGRDELERLNLLEQAIRANAQRELDEYRQREQEKANATAKSIEEGFTRAIQQIRAQSASLFPADRLEGGLESLAQKVDIIVQQLQRMPS